MGIRGTKGEIEIEIEIAIEIERLRNSIYQFVNSSIHQFIKETHTCMPLEPLWLHSLSSLFRCQTGSFYFSLPKQLAIMTDSLWSIAEIVQAKAAHAAECNEVP